jgi:choline monooxygenase
MFQVHEDIRQASCLPTRFYTDSAVFDALREKVFARSWQFIGATELVKVPGQVYPFTLLDGCLSEPLLLTRDFSDKVHCVSNVCTHRGTLVCEGAGNERSLRCRYHGRRFGLDGKFQSMPEFEGCANFPSEKDDLVPVKIAEWKNLLFCSLDPAMPFEEWIADLDARLGWLPVERFAHDATRDREYLVRAHWALYCDNYLEGFHIPYVHAGLTEQLDYGNYTTELFRYSTLQLGVARGAESVFDLPSSSPDHGKNVAAYYFWLFPNQMLNFYPWGLSVNIVQPLEPDLSKVSFVSFVWDASKLDQGAGASLDRVEREDEAVVEAVQKGLRGRFYVSGRYSPTRETGTHHLHRLLVEHLNKS